MRKCIVSLVSEQTVPNFLFIKDKIELQDSLLFISTDKFKDRITWIKAALGYVNCKIDELLLENEEKWDEIVAAVKGRLSPDIYYKVNLTCGTKYMILAVHQAFQGYKANFYYIPYPKNTVLEVAKDLPVPLRYRISVEEYLTNYGVKFTDKSLSQSREYTETFFKLFVQRRLRKEDYCIIDLLRNYRDKKQTDIKKVEETKFNNDRRPQISGLSSFLSEIQFPLDVEGTLSRKETEYLTGGWFEEYVYHKIKESVHPQDIKLGLEIRHSDDIVKNAPTNDLDVVFTYGNKLFVVECKTGILGQGIFNQTVHKAASIKETLLGLSANSYIFSLLEEDNVVLPIAKLIPITKTMGIIYFHKNFFVDDGKFEEIVKDINKKAKD